MDATIKKILSDKGKKRFEDAAFKENHIKNMKTRFEDLQLREYLSEKSKQLWKDPAFREKATLANKIARRNYHNGYKNNPASIRMKKLHKSDSYKESLVKALSSPKVRLAMSVSATKRWGNYKDRLQAVETKIGGFWYGNIRYYEGQQYCELWTDSLRERCRAYFNYTCVECGTPQNGRKLSVHHVHYNKKSCCDGSPRDLVALCTDCHGATNHNRAYWEQHFTEMLHGYYGGKSFFTKEEYAAYKNSV